MPTTARSAPSRKKIEMVALRLSTWAVPRQISSMKGKSMDSRRGDPMCSQLYLLSGWQEGLGASLDFTIIESQLCFLKQYKFSSILGAERGLKPDWN